MNAEKHSLENLTKRAMGSEMSPHTEVRALGTKSCVLAQVGLISPIVNESSTRRPWQHLYHAAATKHFFFFHIKRKDSYNHELLTGKSAA